MVELRRLTKRLQEAGYPYEEVTKKGDYYYVLHITGRGQGMPVVFLKTKDRGELMQYIEHQYQVRGD